MDKIPEVEDAKALMTEAMTWSVMKWLREKKKVRKTADKANAALDRASQTIREQWPESVRTIYEVIAVQAVGASNPRRQPKLLDTNPDKINATQSKEKDDEAYRARMDAEATFDLAEKQLSTSLAREGCRKAIYSWDMHAKAIRIAEGLIRSK
jgi:hypothetical protein